MREKKKERREKLRKRTERDRRYIFLKGCKEIRLEGR